MVKEGNMHPSDKRHSIRMIRLMHLKLMSKCQLGTYENTAINTTKETKLRK